MGRIQKEDFLKVFLISSSLVYYGVIIFLANELNIWEDEVYSLKTSSGTLAHTFRQSFQFELQPPVYFILLRIWRLFSDSIIWARLLSVLFILIGQYLLYRFTFKYTGTVGASIISLFYLINPYTIYAILEIRPYAMVILLSIALLISFFYTYYANDCILRRRIFFILLATFGIFTQYYIGFLLFSLAIVLSIKQEWKSLKFYLYDMIIPLLLILLSAKMILYSAELHTNALTLNNLNLNKKLIDLKVFFLVTLYDFLPLYLNLSSVYKWIIRAVFIILLIASIKTQEAKKQSLKIISFAIPPFVIMCFFALLLLQFGKDVVHLRYKVVIFSSVLFFLTHLLKIVRPVFIYFWFGTVIIIHSINGFAEYKYLYKVNDFKSLSYYLEQVGKAAETETPVLVYRNISADILLYYYNGINKVMPIPDSFNYEGEFGEEQWRIDEYYLHDLEDSLSAYNSFFLVLDHSPLRGVEEATDKLVGFLKERYEVFVIKHFRGNIELYRFYQIN